MKEIKQGDKIVCIRQAAHSGVMGSILDVITVREEPRPSQVLVRREGEPLVFDYDEVCLAPRPDQKFEARDWVMPVTMDKTSNPDKRATAILKPIKIGQVVDSVDRGRLGKEGVISVNGLHPVGHDGRMPVVAMNDVWLPIHLLEHLDGGPAEKDEPFGVVGIHVDALAIVILGAVHHIDRHLLADGALQDARRFGALFHRHGERC